MVSADLTKHAETVLQAAFPSMNAMIIAVAAKQPAVAAALSALVDEAAGEMRECAQDDPDDICAGIPENVLWAGIAAKEKCDADMEDYISGQTPDWDDAMICAAIFKAMLRAMES